MNAGSTKLQYALKTLRAHWEQARGSWQDQVAQDFEDRQLKPMEYQVDSAMRGMDKLSEVMMKMKRDCS